MGESEKVDLDWAHTHHPTKCQLFEGYEFDQEGFEELFRKLDINDNGRIGVDELSEGLKRLGIHHMPGQAQVCLQISSMSISTS